jgi:hypothetical protein
MKNIHVLPTKKPSNLLLCIKDYIEHKDTPAENSDIKGNFRLGFGIYANTDFYQFQNIYITSDVEIKEGDWYKTGKFIWKMRYPTWGEEGQGDAKKIILTTDQKLIADGVQAIDDEFLEWFVKNPSCERVDVDKTIPYNFDGLDSVSQDKFLELFHKSELFDEIKYNDVFDWSVNEGKDFLKLYPTFKIIIPKEEPYERTAQSISLSEVDKEEPKQETLSWDELVREVGGEEQLIKILKLPHIAPLIREAMLNNCKK